MIRRILVTGANKGVGKALCKKILKDHDDTYVLLGSRDEERGRAAAQEILIELGDSYSAKLEVLVIDVSDDESVKNAALKIKDKYGEGSLYGIVNNAGIANGTTEELLKVNLYGPKRVCDEFLPFMSTSAATAATNTDIKRRVVNVSSGSAPRFVSKLPPAEQAFFDTHTSITWEQLEKRVKAYITDTTTATAAAATTSTATTRTSAENSSMDAYAFSKACLNVYTIQLASQYPDMCINSITPGFIDTDLVRDVVAQRVASYYMPYFVGAFIGRISSYILGTRTPEEGTLSAIFCLFGQMDEVNSGRYYGSDARRSPLNAHREPGTAAWEEKPSSYSPSSKS